MYNLSKSNPLLKSTYSFSNVVLVIFILVPAVSLDMDHFSPLARYFKWIDIILFETVIVSETCSQENIQSFFFIKKNTCATLAGWGPCCFRSHSEFLVIFRVTTERECLSVVGRAPKFRVCILRWLQSNAFRCSRQIFACIDL